MNSKQGTPVILVIGIICLLLGVGVGYFISPTNDVSEYEARIQSKENELANVEAEKTNLQNQINELTEELNQSTVTIEQVNEDYQQLLEDYNELQENDTTEQLETTIDNQEETINQLETTIDELENNISNLNSQITELENITPPIRKGEWDTIATFTRIGDYTSDYFFVPELEEVELRITWVNYEPDFEENGFGKKLWELKLYEKGAEETYAFIRVPELKEGTWLIHSPIPTGQTYLDIITCGSSHKWKVEVEAWIPE